MQKIKSLKRVAITKWLPGAAFGVVLAAALPIQARAQGPKPDRPDQASQQELKIPHTAPEHRERAEQYQKKAAEYRQDAESHRKMLADYSKTVAKNPKEVGENTYIKKMRLHCEKYIKDAESLARDADEMAKWHLMRAKELEGK